MAKWSDGFGADEYRRGGLERLQEAWTLLRAEQFAGSIYLAGRGVEGMLRAIIWKADREIQQGRKTLETGHDLRDLLSRVRDLGLLRSDRDLQFEASVQWVGRHWFNNMRFASERFTARFWRRVGHVHARQTLKQAAAEFLKSCSAIIKRCEAICGSVN